MIIVSWLILFMIREIMALLLLKSIRESIMSKLETIFVSIVFAIQIGTHALILNPLNNPLKIISKLAMMPIMIFGRTRKNLQDKINRVSYY